MKYKILNVSKLYTKDYIYIFHLYRYKDMFGYMEGYMGIYEWSAG